MRCHIATAVSVRNDRRPNPLNSVLRTLTRPMSGGLNLVEHLVAGATASAAAVAAMHPMDTIKTVIQAAGTTVKPSTFGALSTTLRTGGIPALYKGLSGSLSGQVPAGAVKFAAFEGLTQFATSLSPKRKTGPAADFACAALAFVCCSVVLVPFELMKQRVQAGMYPGLVSGFRTLLRSEGPKALYTGYRATLLRDVPYTMLEFGLYAQFKKIFRATVNKSKLTSKEEIILGGIAGGCTGFLTTPLDLAKTKLMTQGAAVGAARYKGVVDVLVKVGKSQGPRGLFVGSAARVIWLIPFTAVYFGVHEASKRALLDRKMGKATTALKPKTS